MATEKRLIDANRVIDTLLLQFPQINIPFVQMALDSIPTVDAVEVVHGRWMATPVYKFDRAGRLNKYCDNYHCSECQTERPIVPPYNYCPNCGAKMDVERRTDG